MPMEQVSSRQARCRTSEIHFDPRRCSDMHLAASNYCRDPNCRGTIGAIDESVTAAPPDTGSNFRIASCQYTYNLSASALGVGTYRVDIKINGTVVGSGIFGLK